MKFSQIQLSIVLLFLCLVNTLLAQGDKKEAPKEAPLVELTEEQSLVREKKYLSYSHGYVVGKQLLEQKEFIFSEEFQKGLKDALAGVKNPITPEQFQAAMAKLQPMMKAAHEKRMGSTKEEQIKKREAAQAAQVSKMKARWVTDRAENGEMISTFLKDKLLITGSGLQYKVLNKGEGDSPAATDSVVVHYTGYLTDGSVFDTSKSRGPATFNITQVIKGWGEGLQLMKIGSKFRFKIPPVLAYGDKGFPPVIPANSTLVFDVELIGIRKAR